MPPFAGDSSVLWLTAQPQRRALVQDETHSLPRHLNSQTVSDDWDIGCNVYDRLQKRVSFAMYKNKTYDVLHVKDYSYLELRSTWITAEELQEQKRESKKDIAASQSGNKDICIRGLEIRSSSEAKRKRKQKKSDHRFAVMQEQFKQKTWGRIEPERLAQASLCISENCYRQAKIAGLQDEQEAISVIIEAYDEGSLFGYDYSGLLLLSQAA
jgi:hypothetical protein